MRTTAAALFLAVLFSLAGDAEPLIQNRIRSGAPDPPESPLASRVEALLENMKETLYQAKTEIDEETGSLRCDCSGFIGYVLRNYFPEAYLSLRGVESPWRTRPYSVTYHETFVSSGDEGSGSGGWRRIRRVMDGLPGDVLAWRKKSIERGVSTGHTCMIAGLPTREADGRIRLRVIDSTNARHANDSRPPGTTGVGTGEMWFAVNAAGEPIGFFVNEHRAKANSNKIAIGRLIGEEGAPADPLGIATRREYLSVPEDARFIGLEKEDAIALAEESGQAWRIVLEDDVVSPVSMSIRDDRINFVIERGRLVRVRRG